MLLISKITLILLFFSLSITWGQSYNVKQVSGLQKLSQSSIRSICVDQVGYIWLGTEFGLNRYDGQTIQRYFYNNDDSLSLSGDYINSVYEDRDGRIWVSSANGLCLYNRKKDSFIRNPLRLKNKILGSVNYENETEIWFPGGDLNFYVFNKKTNEVSIKPIQLKIKSPAQFSIEKIIEYDNENLLLLIQDLGLFLYNINSGTLDHFLALEAVRLTGLEKIGDFFYVSTYNDVYKITKQGEVISTFDGINPEFKGNIFLDLRQNPDDGRIWLSSDYGGVFIVNTEFDLLQRIKAGSGANDILPENSIKKIYFAASQNVILGTVRCGAVILYSSGINHYQYNNANESGPSDKSILCLEEDRNHHIWIGTDGGGLNFFDREKDRFIAYSMPDVIIVTSMLDYSEDKLLVASYQKGLFFFDKKTKKFSDAHSLPLFKEVNKNSRQKIFKDPKDNIWISDGELLKVNLKSNTTERFNEKTHPEVFDKILPIYFSVFESSSGKLWFCSVGGLFSYSLKNDRIEDKIVISDFDRSFGNTVYSVVEDASGNLIVGTGKGLAYYNFQDNTLTRYLTDEAYNSKWFSSLYIDSKSQVWAGTNDVLLQIVSKDTLKEVSVFNSLETNGDIEYRHGAILRASDKNLYMGSNNGITYFVPEQVKKDVRDSKVTISSFKKIDNKKGGSSDSTVAIDIKNDFQAKFKYSSAIYEFKFNAFNIPFEEYTDYSYTLENYEDIWHVGKLNTATYTNLEAGDYIFRVKSTNIMGRWGTQTTDIYITILPPWYKTTWFISLVIIAITGLIIVVWRESLVRLKLKHQIELREAEQEQLKVSNQQKIQFFTNISHELKTPLTLIYTPLNQLLKKNTSEREMKMVLPTIYRNVRRMMELIDQLLQFRKAEISTLKLEACKVDCVKACEEIIDYFTYYAKIEGINIILEKEEDEMEVELDRDKFVKIMFNLITNALKNSVSGDSIIIAVSWCDDQICIEVKDTGMGISEEDQKRIFERYYQIEKKVGGTGIGLALTKHLVELHGGKISLESELGKGTVFFVVLPKKQNTTEETATAETLSAFKSTEHNLNPRDYSESDINKVTTILVVEDEPELRHFLKIHFSKDYRVFTAANGEEAFTSAVKYVPDLIVSDIMMPEMDGYQLCEKVKSDIRISHIPVVLLTAKSESEDHMEGMIAGADLYISKPFDLELLKLQISSLIKNREILKTRFGSDPHLKVEDLTHNSLDKEFMNTAINLVNENLENQDYKVSDFVSQMGMSRTLVYSKINALAGKPVKDFILHVRLQKAAKMIVSSDKPISDIAYECGFSDPSYFSTVFKRYYAQSPLKYRSVYMNTSLSSTDLE
ncbi:response regulator [Maribellus luteus]|uniref:histidine kinase n=1 Tax=Maribellus luteus TaxID=2305463 RepID=A0A399SPZ4_9BACT|nr:two-component regulator propeller domain-containing protein [Maribellus luteus]RIJ45770.1 response regulator [Maribellus luteus]